MRWMTLSVPVCIVALVQAEPPKVTLIRLPGGGIQPAAAAADGVLHVVYMAGSSAASDLYYIRRDPGAETFGTPLRVNTQPGAGVALGGVRGPDIALGSDGRVHVAWAGSSKWRAPGSTAAPQSGGHAQTPMLYARLADDGKSFEPERNLMTRSTVLDGGGAVAAAHDKVYVVWHANDKDGGDEADRRVWIAASEDQGKTFAAETAPTGVDAGMCACCSLAAVASPDGPLYLLARTAREGTRRDATFFTVTPAGASPAAVDAWQIGMCPATTFDLAPSAAGPVLAWETRGQAHWARLESAGALSKPVAAPVADPKARLNREHPRTAVNDGVVLLVWVESGGMGRPGAIAWQAYDPHGQPIDNAAGHQPDLPAWSYPAPIARPDGGFEIMY